jgi:DNA-3-methyladenine glycosylase
MLASVPGQFFNRSADIVARELIGCHLCVNISDSTNIERLAIHETEAYMGPHDLACHSSKGKTKRTEVLFQEAGTIYVYLIYGMYSMLNIVTGAEGYPAAVLVRGAGVYDGPGKLTKALKITRDKNGLQLGRNTGIWIERQLHGRKFLKIQTTPRIGVAYAQGWAQKKLRFVLKK